jgi:predicted dehydrogenase
MSAVSQRKAVRVAVVATGHCANYMHLAACQEREQAEIACVCDVDSHAARSVCCARLSPYTAPNHSSTPKGSVS